MKEPVISNSKIVEFFTISADNKSADWKEISERQHCGHINNECSRFLKGESEVPIGACTVQDSKEKGGVIICSHRLTEQNRIFFDCIHLLEHHKPGNEIHVLPRMNVMGGFIDYFLASVHKQKVVDFVGIEMQFTNTSGTLTSERLRFLRDKGLLADAEENIKEKRFSVNMKISAKTMVSQLNNKIETFEQLGKHLVLVLQDNMFETIKSEYPFEYLSEEPQAKDAMHFHTYALRPGDDKNLCLSLSNRYSTNSDGLCFLMGLKATPRIDVDSLVSSLESRVSSDTLLKVC